MTDDPLWLFSYGTLRQAGVQRALFGRLLAAEPDALAGYRLDSVTITDPQILATSGVEVHPILVPDPAAPPIPGSALAVNEADLVPADAYEGETYARIAVTLASGRRAFVYVAAG